MKTQWMLPLVLATAMLPMTGVADEKETDPKSPPTATDPKTPPPAATSSKVQELADKYKVPPAEVQGLRDKKMGWGEIDKALAIAQKSGKPLDEIMKLRESGMGWGQIAQKYGFKLGDVVGRGGERGDKGDRSERGKAREERAHEHGSGRMGDHGPSGMGEGHGRGR